MMDTIKGIQMGKNKIILLVIFLTFLSAQFFSQTDNSKTGGQEELEIFLMQPGLQELSSGSIQIQIEQEELKHEVTVILKLIQVYVTDKKGNPVTDLEQSDFILYDKGKLQTITDFERHIFKLEKEIKETKSDLAQKTSPLLNRKFFILLDYGRNGLYGINKSKIAALHFIDTQIQPTDEVAVLSFSALRGLILHEYLTTNHKIIREAVKKMRGFPGGFGGSAAMGLSAGESYMQSGALVEPSGSAAEESRSSSVNALESIKILRDFAKSLRYIPGYKNIIFFSKGFSGGSMFRDVFEDLCKELASSNTPVHSVWSANNRSSFGNAYLRRMSDLSGGKYFNDVADYESIARGIQDITGNYYVLGYYIDENWDGKYRKIKVEVKRKGCLVHAQGGYFNPKPFTEYSESEKRLHLFDLAMSENPQFQVPTIFPSIALPFSEKEESNLVMLSEIPIDKIKEITRGETEVLTLIFDEEKNIAEYHIGEVNFYTLPYNKICIYSISSLLPGKYECRLVIRDIKTGKGAVASSSVVIPEASDSGIKLFPPLLLIPEKKTFYLKLSKDQKKRTKKDSLSINDIYPFLANNFSPLVEEVDRGISSLLAVVRLSIIDIPDHEIEFSVHLFNPASQEKVQLTNSFILSNKNIEGTEVLLLEIQLPELEPGDYSIEITADEMTTHASSQATRNFKIR